MAVKRRWMKWIFEEVENMEVTLPWERTADRRAWRRHLSGKSPLLKLVHRA